MKKSSRIAIFIIAVLILLSVVFAINHQVNEKYFYLGDRIVLNISARVDGQKYDIKDNDVSCSGETVHRNRDSFSIRANDYGKYVYIIKVKGSVVKVSLMHTNWWEINSATLKFNIDTKNKKITYDLEENQNFEKSINNSNVYELYYMF